ncbi:heterokaryon incompatibility protein-domain-containing protein, partial [Fusarium flagelliforme]|uniref:heterokaryon incompatibility protein-domain-containing protein n=1 Tax=Fusarium flagelliforme TaxID=2675880 RepID=UPI001E8D9B11
MDGRESENQHVSPGSGEISASNGTLCEKCLAVSWKPDDVGHRQRVEGLYEWELDHHETFSDLEASCEAGCPLCQTLFLLLFYDGLGFGTSGPLLWGLAPSGLANDLRALHDESIKPWFEACLCPRAHMNCPNLPPNEEVSYRMPTRLIDVGSERQPTAKLVMSENLSEHDRKSPYLILSYQWGKGNNPARTTSKNLEERKVEIKVQNMPKTIRDAIDITRLIGIRYLWVDAVCIIQADTPLGSRQQDDVALADWEQESMNMAAYYSNALCCIAATSAKDSSEGFLTERRVMRYGYKEWHPQANVFALSPHAVRRQFRNSLLSRGWCLQEWLLSTRILHWTSNGLIWQCPHGFFWEGQSGFQGELPKGFTDIHDGPRWTNDCIFDLGFNNLDTEAICRILFCDDKNAVG